jgi:LacI family transcriptional regulator
VSEPRARGRRASEPTILDVARAAGVSKSTVSNVMRDVAGVAPATRERVLAAVAAVGYRPNVLARNLVRGTTTTVGIVVGDLANPIFSELAKLAEQRLAEAGLATMICNTDGQSRSEQERVEMLLEHRVAGVLMLQYSGESATLERLREAGTAVVVMSQWEEGTDCVVLDDRRGAELATTHLLDLGHRRIAYLSSALLEHQTESARLDGYRQALRRAHVRWDRALAVRIGDPGYLRGDDHLRATMLHLLGLDDPVTAVFASNDLLAVDVLETVEELGLRVPGDVSIVGFDDIRVAGLARISLTTVVQPCEDLARLGIEILLARIGGATAAPRQVVLAPALVVRSSSAPPALAGQRDVAHRLPDA